MNADALTTKLTRALLDLGDTPDTVAAYLEAQGCRGRPFDTQGCPVSVYLKRTFDLTHVYTGVTDAYVFHHARMVDVEVPAPVGDFVVRFDAHKYPALEEKP